MSFLYYQRDDRLLWRRSTEKCYVKTRKTAIRPVYVRIYLKVTESSNYVINAQS